MRFEHAGAADLHRDGGLDAELDVSPRRSCRGMRSTCLATSLQPRFFHGGTSSSARLAPKRFRSRRSKRWLSSPRYRDDGGRHSRTDRSPRERHPRATGRSRGHSDLARAPPRRRGPAGAPRTVRRRACPPRVHAREPGGGTPSRLPHCAQPPLRAVPRASPRRSDRMTTPQVSAVIVAWNAGDTLGACVESLRDSTRRADAAMQIVVVDNASSDGAVENLRSSPATSSSGTRSTRAMAWQPRRASRARTRRGSCSRTPIWWSIPCSSRRCSRQPSRAAPEVATLVPELRFAARPRIVNCRGLTVDEIGIPAEVDAGTQVTNRKASTARILGGSSGCCLLRADHVRALGGPEPAFFAYLEDVDLALRLRCAGYGAVFVPEAIAFHEGSASTGARSPLKVHLVARNRRLLFRLHGPRSLRATGWRALTDLAHAAYSTVGTPLAPWAGRVEALRFRRYTAFLRRARKRAEPCRAEFDRPPRASLSATLRRKRTVVADEG